MPATHLNHSRKLGRLAGSAALIILSVAASFAQTPLNGFTPSGIEAGSPVGSYAVSDFENVSLFSGGLNVALPLLKVGGRGEAQYTIMLRPVRSKWIVQHQRGAFGTSFNYPSNEWWSGFTPGYTPGLLEGRRAGAEACEVSNLVFTLTRLTFTTADGTEYELRDTLTGGATKEVGCRDDGQPVFNRGKVFATADGTSATFISDVDIKDFTNGGPVFQPSGYLMFSSGLRYRISNGGVDWMRDRNGNQLKFTGTTSTKIVDSLNREVEIEYDVNDVAPYGHCDRITYKGFGGQTRVIRISEAPMSTSMQDGETIKQYFELFDGMWGAQTFGTYNDSRITAVWLPDGRSYKFRYNSYGEIGRIELPTGGAVEYDYGPGVVGAYGSGLVDLDWSGGDGPGDAPYQRQTIVRRAWVRREYPDGGTGASFARRTVYSGSGSSCGADTESTVGVLHYKPNGTLEGVPVGGTRHWFYGSPCGSVQWAITNPAYSPPWKEGREFRTDLLAPDNQTVLRKLEMKWEQPAAGTTWPLTQPETNYVVKTNNPQVTQILTTLSDTGQVTKQTFAYDQYSNKTDVYEYDFGATAETLQLIRRTHTDFVSAAAYVGANVDPLLGSHLRSLPLATWVTADGGSTNKLSLTTFDYDQLALTPRANITGLCVTSPNAQCTPANPSALVKRGNPTGVTRYTNPAGNTGAITTTAAYDVAGNVVSMTDANGMSDPAGHTTQFIYGDAFCNGSGCDDTFNPNTFAFVQQIKTPKPDPTNIYSSVAELTTTTVYDFWTGQVYSTTDANNQTTHFEYESQPAKLDRVKAVVRPDGGRTDFNYGDTVGELFVQTLSALDGTRTLESKRYFDGLGRVYRTATNENSVASQPWLNVDTEYDEMGRARQVSMPYRSAGGGTPLTPEEWSNTKRTETVYDDLGRVWKVITRPDNAVVKTDYSGNRVLVTDQVGRQRIIKTDAVGRLREVWEVSPNDPAKYPGVETTPSEITAGLLAAAYGYRTEYFYDALGKLRRVKQGSQQRFFAYDTLNRLVRASNPEQGSFTPDPAGGDFPLLNDSTSGVDNDQWSIGYLYDANGNLTKRRDARGTTTTYGYDALNRNVTVTYALGGQTAATPNVTRYYDNPAVEANGKGRLWKSEAAQTAQTIVDKYDEAGRPKEQAQKFWVGINWGPQTYITKLNYNKAGRVTELTYPSDHKVYYQYDAAGRLGDNGAQPAFKGTLGDGAERTYASQVTYSEFGGMQQERFGTQTALYHKLHYNRRGQLFDIRLSTASLAADEWNWNRGAIVNYYSGNYAWEGDPNTPASADNNGNLRRQQHFVPTDDQVSGHTFTQQTYEYDAFNRLSAVVEAAAVNGTVGPDSLRQAYDYDRWGNRTINADGTWRGPLPPAPSPTPAPSELVNEKQFDKSDLQNTNRLYAPGDTVLPMSERQMRYDATGNLTHDAYTGTGVRTYDAENRMTEAADNNGGTTFYAYDADGRRVRRLVGTLGEVWQVYGAGGELLAEYAKETSPLSPRKEYGYRGGALLVTAEPSAAGWGPAPDFYENPLNPNHPGETPVRSRHITELRSAIDALRAHKGLPGYGWQAAAGVGDPVTINPITEMRAALNEALGAPSGGYSAGLAQWQPILAVHLQELRNRVLGAWQSGGSGVDLRWLVTDQLGTPRMVVDKTGSLAGVSRHDYLPFGEELYINVGGRTTTQGYGAADTVRQKFTGKERDSETGIDYFATRYYSSTQGRFTSPDSLYFAADRLADPQKFNLYGYVRNNPLNTIDPDGRDGVVVGQTPQDVDETVKYLKRIAPGTKVDADGTIHKPGFFRRLWNRVSGHGAGTALVSAIVDSNKTVAISAGRTILSGVLGNTGIPSSKLTDKSAAIFGVDKSKVDYVIAFDPSKSTPTALRQSDGTITEKDAAPEMVLAHELIHASQFLRGVKYDQTPADHVFQEAGKWHLEEVAKSELQTVGLAPGGNITENKIRRELGYLPRAAYFTRNQWSR